MSEVQMFFSIILGCISGFATYAMTTAYTDEHFIFGGKWWAFYAFSLFAYATGYAGAFIIGGAFFE